MVAKQWIGTTAELSVGIPALTNNFNEWLMFFGFPRHDPPASPRKQLGLPDDCNFLKSEESPSTSLDLQRKNHTL